MVEAELLILKLFGNAIDFSLALMDHAGRVEARYTVNAPLFGLLCEDWPFAHTYHDVRRFELERLRLLVLLQLSPKLFNLGTKVHIAEVTFLSIQNAFLLTQIYFVVHIVTPCLAFLFDFLNLVNGRLFLGL